MSPQKCANAENLKFQTWTAAAAFANILFFSFLNEVNEIQHPSDITGWLTYSFSCIYLFLDTYAMLYVRMTARSMFSSKL